MTSFLPSLTFVLAWVLAIAGVTPAGADSSAPFDEETLRWMLLLGAGVFLLLAGVNHIVEIFRDRNYAPVNTVILVSDLGVPTLRPPARDGRAVAA